MNPVRAFIAGCASLDLGDDEQRFFAEAQPWGLILFKRNVESPDQLRRLTAAFRASVGRADAPVLVDQEGGRVQRLGPPHWPVYPPGAAYTAAGGVEAARIGARLIAADLRDVGITVDCAPVLDILTPATHKAIGNRAFGADAASVATLGRAFADGLLEGSVLPVVKHVPGHGRATVDSHLELPVVDCSVEDLKRVDFAPFAALADLPMAMTAHVVYRALDPSSPATTSRSVVERIIRGFIGFDGLLLSDDLSMEALKGSIGDRAAAAFAAGCDIALHCNGKLDEARAVASASPVLDSRAAARAEHALTRIAGEPAPVPSDLRRRFDDLVAVAAA